MTSKEHYAAVLDKVFKHTDVIENITFPEDAEPVVVITAGSVDFEVYVDSDSLVYLNTQTNNGYIIPYVDIMHMLLIRFTYPKNQKH